MLLQTIQNAGPIGYILTGLSLVALTVTFERLLFWLQSGGSLPAATRRQVLDYVRRGKESAALRLLEDMRNREARAMTAVYSQPPHAHDKTGDVVLSREIRATNQFLFILDLISVIAPMLGILGTVVGIVHAFSGMKGSNPDTAVMISGLSVSMLTTAIGLVVALSSLIPHNLFACKAHRYQTELAELIEEYAIARRTVEVPAESDVNGVGKSDGVSADKDDDVAKVSAEECE